MDSSEEERRPFEKVTIKFRSPENDVMCPGVLSLEIIKQVGHLNSVFCYRYLDN